MTMELTDRRIGTFDVNLRIIQEHPEAVKAMLGKTVVLRADQRIERAAIKYVAQCDQFSEVHLGELLPRYRAIFSKHEDGSVSFDGFKP